MNVFLKTASSLALATALAVSPFAAMAQSTETAPDAAIQTVPDAAGTDTAQGTADPATTPVDPMAGSDTAEATETPTKPVEGQIVMQDENTILSSDLVGSNVYSDTGESIGEINDLIVGLDGSVGGVVLGVGGFLGLGEKSVAIQMTSLSTSTDENGNLRLVTSATRADLEAAEAFLTRADLQAAQQSLDNMPAEGTPAQQPAPSN